MKAPILESFDKGLKMVRSITKPEQYGTAVRWIIRFRNMYKINRSPDDENYIYFRTLEDEFSKVSKTANLLPNTER